MEFLTTYFEVLAILTIEILMVGICAWFVLRNLRRK